MPRRKRSATGGIVFHVLNRAVARQRIFATEGDYTALQHVLEEARAQVPIRLLAYCLMPNHWHLVLWPRGDDELSEFMQWMTMTHSQRWHAFHGTAGTGSLYQGRFKSFPVQDDEHFYTVVRYVERNALRARLVSRVEAWRWSSVWQFAQERCDVSLDAWPLPRPNQWVSLVNEPQTDAEVEAVRTCIRRGAPYGDDTWRKATAKRLGLEKSLQARGRPRR